MSWLISLTRLCLILSIINLTLSVVKQKLGKTLFWMALCRATAYVVHFSTYTPSNSSSRNSSDQPA
ncbi:hypothetical protein, partial [Glaesserella parasuis]